MNDWKNLIAISFFILFFGLHLSTLDILAQSCSQLGLPENAVARLCRSDGGNALDLDFSPDGKTLASIIHYTDVPEILSASNVQQWLSEARKVNLTDSTFQRGILMLEQFLVVFSAEETRLLSNYPNPFNPETWIPYQLSEPAEVTLRIYSVNGILVRTLVLGHTPAGIYQSRSRAAYWDGKNDVGESVASGLYFYTLTAGDFTATRKLLIRK